MLILYDLDQYGKLISLEYMRNIVEGFDFKLGVTKIIGNDIEVIGSDIKGKFSNTSNTNEIIELNVIEEEIHSNNIMKITMT